MILPLGTDRTLSRPTRINHILVAANVALFLAERLAARIVPQTYEAVRDMLVLDPLRPTPWTFVSYAFLHAGLLHLLGNMLFLWVFGPAVEHRFGRPGYLLFYLAAAAAAGGAHVLTESAPVLGASGAVAAVTGAYLILFPFDTVRVLVVFVIIGIYHVPAWWLIAAQIAWNLVAQELGWAGNVATQAHLAGYASGMLLALALRWLGLIASDPNDLIARMRQAQRRRQFRILSTEPAPVRTPPDRPAPADESLARDRRDVLTLTETDLAAAAAAYKRLLHHHGRQLPAALLPRRAQYDLANHFFQTQDHTTAAIAYEVFLAGYPSDAEAPQIRLMLGLIYARYLNDPATARGHLAQTLPHLSPPQRALAEELLADLGCPPHG